MALSPYKSHENIQNRSRSSSLSSPVRNRIVYQEIYSLGENTLVRSYSCDQVFDKDNSGQPFQATQIHVSSFLTPDFKLRKTPSKIKEIKTKPRKLEIAGEETDRKQSKRKLKMDSASEKISTNNNIFKKTIKYIFFSFITMYMVCLYVRYRECNYVWDLERTKNELDNLFGQNEAVTRINSVLSLCNNSNDVYTMVFTGGVGVGKTYASSIISSNFPWSSNKLIVFSESYDDRELTEYVLSECGCNLIIIDDLSVRYLNSGINLVKILSRKRKNEKLLIILIYSTKTEEEQTLIVKAFQNSYINFYHVPFTYLTKDDVTKCFEREIKRLNAQIPSNDLDKLIEGKMRHVSVVKGPTGCKGVADEVSSYITKINS